MHQRLPGADLAVIFRFPGIFPASSPRRPWFSRQYYPVSLAAVARPEQSGVAPVTAP
jgi:hypothetical protein